jgi:hypothetical protein
MVWTTAGDTTIKLIIHLHAPPKLKIYGDKLHSYVVLNIFPVFPQVPWMRIDFSVAMKISTSTTVGRERFPSHFGGIFFRHGLQSRSGFSVRVAAAAIQPCPSSPNYIAFY